MKIGNFELYRDLLRERSGLVLTQEKSYLLESRLRPVAKKWGFDSIDALTLELRGMADDRLIKDVVEAMTTNETLFFRDTKPFKLFEETVLPYLSENRRAGESLKIWCAACSSGQEPYSLAMLLKEQKAKLQGRRADILATDISHEILNAAREGIYSQFEVQRGLPIQQLMTNFTQINEKWQINEDLRKMVRFEYFNLLESMARMGPFDVVFCRNVLIYFDEPTKKQVLENIAGTMKKDGFLFLGGAETVLGLTDKFEPMTDKRGIYVLKGQHNVQALNPDKALA